jgi:hypothetical protein
MSELKAQTLVEQRNAEDHSRAAAVLRERETKLLAEVAELEIHTSATKSQVARMEQEQEQEVKAIATGCVRACARCTLGSAGCAVW